MADKPMSGMAIDDSLDGTERILAQGADGSVILVSAMAAYAVDQLHGAAVITSLNDSDEVVVFQSDVEKIITVENLGAWVVDEIEAVATGDTITSGDKIVYSDGGTLKQIDIDDVETYLAANLASASHNFTDMDAVVAIAGTDVFALDQGEATKKLTYTQLSAEIWSELAANVAGYSAISSPSDSDQLYVSRGGADKSMTLTVLATYISNELITVIGPDVTTENNVPQWDDDTRELKDGLSLQTTVREDGVAVDTALATEKAIRTAIDLCVLVAATDLSGTSWMLDEDDMASDDDTKVPSQQSVKAFASTITNFDIDGATDIGAALVDADLIIVDDGAGGTNRKSAMSRVATYVKEIKLDDFAAPDDNTDLDATSGAHGLMPKDDKVKLDALPEAATVVETTDTDVSGNAWVLDEDTLVSNSATKVPTQQSVKAYVDNAVLESYAIWRQFDDAADRMANPPRYAGQLGHQIDTNIKYVAEDASDNLDTAVYEEKSVSVYTSPQGVAFSADGSKFFIVRSGVVYQYSMTIAFDVSSATYDSVSFDATNEDSVMMDIAFNTAGTKMYLIGNTSTESVYQYTLAGAWNLSTASYASKSCNISAQETSPTGLAFSTDGSKMYIVGTGNDTVYQYTVATPWDISTASYATKSMAVNGQDTAPVSLAISSDGTKVYVLGSANDTVYQYTIGTAWDISTGSYASKSISINSEEATPAGLAVPDGYRFYVCGDSQDDVFQYRMGYEWVELGNIWGLATSAGTGITGAAASYTAGVAKVGSYYRTTIVIDLTGLRSTAADDIIGDDGTSNPCYIGQITAAKNGTIFAGKIECLEAPAGGDPDIDLYSATEATGVEDQAIGDLTETQLLNAGDHVANAFKALTAFPAVNEYLYLVAGDTTDADYTAGILVIELWGK